MSISIRDVKGIGPATEEKLVAAGITSVEDLAASAPEQLTPIPGFGASRAIQVIASAQALVADSSFDEQTDPADDTMAEAAPTEILVAEEEPKKKGKKKSKKESEKKAKKKKDKPNKEKKEKSKKDKKKKAKKEKGKHKQKPKKGVSAKKKK